MDIWSLLSFIVYIVTYINIAIVIIASVLSVQSKFRGIIVVILGIVLEILVTILFYKLNIGG